MNDEGDDDESLVYDASHKRFDTSIFKADTARSKSVLKDGTPSGHYRNSTARITHAKNSISNLPPLKEKIINYKQSTAGLVKSNAHDEFNLQIHKNSKWGSDAYNKAKEPREPSKLPLR